MHLAHISHIQGRYGRIAACKPVIEVALYAFVILLPYACATPAAAETVPQSSGKWQVLSAPSIGEESLALSLKAEKAVKGWMKTSAPILTIQCGKGKVEVYIETGMALEVTMVDQQIVRIQLDGNKPFPQRWREVTNQAVSASTRDATALVKQLAQSQKFMFEFTPFNSAPAQAEFDVAGLAAHLPQLTRTCWGK